MKGLLNIATKLAFGEEAVGAVVVQSCGKVAPSGGRGAPSKAIDKGTKRGAQRDKKGMMR
jgi:hypothetical protein